jgi:hypothetical protein
LFSIAKVNGTLARFTERAVRLCPGHAGVLPVMCFALATKKPRKPPQTVRWPGFTDFTYCLLNT